VVQHGVSFFVFDWYCDYHSGAVPGHDRALDQGFLNAQHRDLMDFAVLWCNEEGPNSEPYTEAKMLLLGKTLGERRFRRPSYLRINRCPVVLVSDPGRVWSSSGESSRALPARRW